MNDTSTTPLATTLAPQPLLVGIIIDVSSSMKRNWPNKDGKKLPRIKVIRDALHTYLQDEQLKTGSKLLNKRIDLFCLGMGFQAPLQQTDIDLSYEQEHSLKGTLQTRRRVDVVCDLLALSAILPDKKQLDRFKELLDQKWKQCSQGILEQSVIPEDVHATLMEYIQQGIYESALKRFHRGIFYRFAHTGIGRRCFGKRDEQVKMREEKIVSFSRSASREYADTIYQKASRYFTDQRSQYTSMITSHLLTFARTYLTSVLSALTLGFEVTELVDDLDEKQAMELARRIQADLEKDVRHRIGLSVSYHRKALSLKERHIGASLDGTTIRRLTERLIRKAGWDILRPLVEHTVLSIFTQQFEAQAKASFPYWIHLASTREVTRSLAGLTNILPEVADDQVYSENTMFGSTPFQQAIDKAAIRLIEPEHREKKKVLLIISDGEFEEDLSSMTTVNLLKRRGVVLATGIVGNKNVLSQLVTCFSHAHAPGTRLMIDIASCARDFNEAGIQWKERKTIHTLKDEKLCFQVNHSFLLENILELIFTG
ncbi:MAG TPA: vWA domain-containing protein [Ktedonobacteraceae bacterium]|jgi:hypothetical protein